MPLMISPADSPCSGHPCDGCKRCSTGRCCRSDNPDYRLPRMGDWAGPIFGRLGVVNDDGDRLECHACGEWFEFLGGHLGKAHDLTALEYKALFGLKVGTGLTSPRLKAVRRALGERLTEINLERGLLGVSLPTPEQTSAYWRGRKRSLQEHIETSETRRAAGRTLAARVRAGEFGVLPNRTSAGKAGAKAVWEKYRADPAKQRERRVKVAAGRGRRLIEFRCTVCQAAFEDIDTSTRKTCGADACKAKARLRAALVNARLATTALKSNPESRARFLAAARRPRPEKRAPTVTKPCRICGAPFTVPNYRAERAKTCSKACAQEARTRGSRAVRLSPESRAKIAEAKRRWHAERRVQREVG